MKKKTSPVIALALLVVIVLLLSIVWMIQQTSAPRQFVLVVENQSSQMVDQVRLFGSALEADALLFKLDSEQSSKISVAIKKSGTLRFEVSQGYNRIDTYIVEDTLVLDDLSQRLVIHDNNRFLIAND